MSERLRQLELVGCGAMAQVFRGALVGEHGTRRTVAIKRLRPELRQTPTAVDLFVNEARIAVRLDHPNVVHALELCRDEDGYALVCEWLECTSLAELCEDGQKLPPFAVIHAGRGVCSALDYLHNLRDDGGRPLGLVHRDVTPANVFLTTGGQVKLGDFGVAWCAGDPARIDVTAGTPEFAAPEQQRGETVDARADLFGLGATLRAVAAEIPADLEAVLARACAPDPARRPPSARELGDELARLSQRVGTTTAGHEIEALVARARERKGPRRELDGAVQSILGDALAPAAGRAHVLPSPAAPRRGPWVRAFAAAAVLAVSAGAYAWYAWQPPPPVEAASPPPVASLPRPAPPPVVLPPAVTALPPAPARPSPRPTPKATATVHVNAVPWARASLDGRVLGNTPLRALTISEGRHVLFLEHPPQNLQREVVIEVAADREQTFIVELRTGAVRRVLAN